MNRAGNSCSSEKPNHCKQLKSLEAVNIWYKRKVPWHVRNDFEPVVADLLRFGLPCRAGSLAFERVLRVFQSSGMVTCYSQVTSHTRLNKN
eukprot:5854435-Amphidinium_carterae.1